MYFSKITANYANLPVRRSEQLSDPDGEHRLLWDFFDVGSDADRPFLYRRMRDANQPYFLMVSTVKPTEDLPGFDVQVKPYDPVIQNGDRFQFSVRINSTVKKDGSYHDIVMNEKHELREDNVPEKDWPGEPELERTSALEWMHKRERGFVLDDETLGVQAHNEREFIKANGNHRIIMTTMDLTGQLTVDDSERFQTLLMNGLGRKAVYGCGLLLLQPIG